MTQPQDKMRAEFEAWCGLMGMDFPRYKSGVYKDDGTASAWEAWKYKSAQSQQSALDAARTNGVSWDSGFLTVVYKGIEPGPEAQELCTHPKASAMSWSHAINDRDAAIAAQGASNV